MAFDNIFLDINVNLDPLIVPGYTFGKMLLLVDLGKTAGDIWVATGDEAEFGDNGAIGTLLTTGDSSNSDNHKILVDTLRLIFRQELSPDEVLIAQWDSDMNTDNNSAVYGALQVIYDKRKDWYSLVLLEPSVDLLVGFVSAWIDELRNDYKLFFVQRTPSTLYATSVLAWITGAQGVTAKQHRTVVMAYDAATHITPAWVGLVLSNDLNRVNKKWGFQVIKGVPASEMTEAQLGILKGRNINAYMPFGNHVVTGPGVTITGERIDTIVTRDWLHKRLHERFTDMLVRSNALGGGIAFTETGIQRIEKAISEVHAIGIRAKHFNDDLLIEPISLASISAQDKQDRVLRVKCQTSLVGAIEKIVLQVHVSH